MSWDESKKLLLNVWPLNELSFVNQIDNTVISIDSFVNVKIIDMNYDKKNFNCIAELVDIEIPDVVNEGEIEEEEEEE